MTTTAATRDPQLPGPITGSDNQEAATGSSGTSGVVAGLLMVTGIGWKSPLSPRAWPAACSGVRIGS